ncbi:MAG: VOC family protein [Bacteroidales bacterium]
MKDFFIGGIQQIGIGVNNLDEAWNQYIDLFGMDCRIFEEDSVARIMLPYTGGEPQKRHAVLALNLQSGGGFEIWQYTGRKPEPFPGKISLGDLGILACKIKVKDIGTAFEFYKSRGNIITTNPLTDPAGSLTFFVKDPSGNLFQMVAGNNWFLDEKKVSGGSYGATIGVSDIDKARVVYSDILGYDTVVYDETSVFSDLAIYPGEEKIRRVLLKNSTPFTGPFARLFGQSVIELICREGAPGKKIYANRFWGDPGFIHMCFDVRGIDSLKEYCVNAGYPFKVDSRAGEEGNSFDMGEAAGHFAYIEDHDGTLIEFVETHKLPLIKKFGWYFDLKKRDSYRPLPDWIVKMLRFSKVRKR